MTFITLDDLAKLNVPGDTPIVARGLAPFLNASLETDSDGILYIVLSEE